MRKAILLLMVAGGFAVLLIPITKPFAHRTTLRTYLLKADGLRPGASVRLAGVQVGTVRTVRARPELHDGPAEVVMALITDYDLRIPNDALVSTSHAGILGETYLEIDASRASGPPVRNGDVLKAEPSGPDAEQTLEHLVEVLRKIPCAQSALQALPDGTVAAAKK